MKIIAESHTEHTMTDAQREFVLAHFADKDCFFIETIELPLELGTVPCALYGPQMGDAPVPESETFNKAREGRKWASRLTIAPLRQDRRITVIAGPHEDHPCVLYTMFGGTPGHQEPGDPDCKDKVAALTFWNDHALAAGNTPC